MNIGVDLRCLQSPYRTGVGEFAFELLSAILKKDKDNNYYLFSNSYGSNQIPRFNQENVFEANFHLPNKIFNLTTILTGQPKADQMIMNKFKLDKLDYFFSPNLNFVSLLPSTKHVLTIHDLTFDLLSNFLTTKQLLWHRLTRPLYQCKKADTILTPSENTRRDLVSCYKIDGKKIKVIYPGISPIFTEVRSRSDIKTKYDLPEKFILFIGTIEPRKNLKNVISAFESAAKSLTENYHLVIAGSPGWKNSEIKNYIKNSSVKNSIHVIGYVADTDKPALYQAASLFVYPSFYEGFGFPVLEAMYSGVPVITSNRSSLPELTAGSCHLVNPHRPAEISSAIVKILSDQNYSKRLIELGKKRSLEFTWEKAANNFLETINALTK